MASAGFNNPYFTQEQSNRGQQGYATPLNPDQLMNARQGAQIPQVADQARLEGMYSAPAAGTPQTGRMTYEDTIVKTAILFGVMLVVAVISWVITLGGVFAPDQARTLVMVPALIGAIGTLVISLVIAFRKQSPVGLTFAYAVAEGLFVGGISAIFEALYPGIVVQAALASIAVIGVTLALFASGKIRASARMTKIMLIALVAYAAFSLLNVILMWTGVFGDSGGFGLRSEVTIMGIPLGLIIGVVVVFMGAYMLVVDFDMVQRGVRNGAPQKLAWTAAYGILSTVVFIYIEILRMIAIARNN
ncbi:Bax inhibitor-1/YccA family protein [Microbacterium indicum]|uniref:Bax inhibitor-1/YccA family protein n=1 Tax=Microbacterium indicum TaxID=358100 RepID=UPI0003F5F544|nr:Bax inhibitor-1/YccA family protein [Microbacterium indicum]